MADSKNLTGVRVMVIDDSNTIRRSAEIFLMQAGCQVILADNGFDALAKIADHQPDLIFVVGADRYADTMSAFGDLARICGSRIVAPPALRVS